MTEAGQRHLQVLLEFVRLMQEKGVTTLDERQHALFAPEFRYHIGGRGRISGTYRGWGEFRRIIVNEVATPAEVQTITANDDHILAVTHLTGERSGKRLDLQVCYVFRFADGKLAEGRSVPFDDRAWDEFWE